MDADGQHPKKLLEAVPADRFLQLQWSPDEQRIAYIRLHNQGDRSQMTIEAVPSMGGQAVVLLTSPTPVGSFSWSSDDRIIFSAAEAAPNCQDMNLWQIKVRTPGPAGPPQRISSWAGLSLLDLSISADAKRLVLVKAGLQRDLYIAELENDIAIGPPRRFSLEGRDDLPSAWTPDGQRLFFYSDRNGNWDIFRQGLQEKKAEDFVLGRGQHIEPRLSSDARWVLYWEYQNAASEKSGLMQMMRVPVSGGVPEPLLQSAKGGSVHCSLRRSRCVLAEPDRRNSELVFNSFDALQGRGAELFRVAADLSESPAWDLSPDGSSVALVAVDERKDRIRVVELNNGSARAVSVGQSAQLTGISWSATGNGWFVASSSPREAALLHVGLNGAVSRLWTTSTAVGTPLASPDARNIAFTVSAPNSNAWLIEGF